MNFIYNIITNDGLISMEFYLRIIISAVLGFFIGTDRVKKSRPAGIKTFTVLCICACLATIISIVSVNLFSQTGKTSMDPLRLPAQLLQAVSFLGAGTIFLSNNKVKGLTSAAFVLLTCSVGIGIGAGLYGLTIFTFLIIFPILKFSNYLERNKYKKEYSKAGLIDEEEDEE